MILPISEGKDEKWNCCYFDTGHYYYVLPRRYHFITDPFKLTIPFPNPFSTQESALSL